MEILDNLFISNNEIYIKNKYSYKIILLIIFIKNKIFFWISIASLYNQEYESKYFTGLLKKENNIIIVIFINWNCRSYKKKNNNYYSITLIDDDINEDIKNILWYDYILFY